MILGGNHCLAVDAMGGDHGPIVVVRAVIWALSRYPLLRICLVGDTSVLTALIATCQRTDPRWKRVWEQVSDRLELVHAPEVVEMDETAGNALRNKKHSSMRVAIEIVKDGQAKACVSGGNTGALMTIARFVLKTIPGIDRPAIIAPMPSMQGRVHMLDLGANVDCSPEQLVQFAMMGSVLVQLVEGVAKPRVGLLNIGVEANKGNALIKTVAQALAAQSAIHYIGSVEGDGIYKGHADVIVCDGFVGNVALKASEGLASLIGQIMREEFTQNPWRRMRAWVVRSILQSIGKRLDPAAYNGATLIGLRGIVVKSHGGSREQAVLSALCKAVEAMRQDVPRHLETRMATWLATRPHYPLAEKGMDGAGMEGVSL